MEVDRLGSHNVVASFTSLDTARQSIDALMKDGIAIERISFLGRAAEEAESQAEARSDADEIPARGAVSATTAGARGAALGGVAGFVVGAAFFGIPGIGPAVGSGIWAATLGGAVAGATAGGVYGGIAKLWDLHYKDEIAEGRLLVGVHSEDPQEIARAEKLLGAMDPVRLDLFDAEGRPPQ